MSEISPMLSYLLWCMIACIVILVNGQQLPRKMTIPYFVSAILSVASYLAFSFTGISIFSYCSKAFFYIAYALLAVCLVVMIKNDRLFKRPFSIKKENGEL